MSEIARFMIIAGALLLECGILLYFAGRIPALDRLPGDLHFQRGNISVYLPLGTMIVISIVLTIILNISARFWR